MEFVQPIRDRKGLQEKRGIPYDCVRQRGSKR